MKYIIISVPILLFSCNTKKEKKLIGKDHLSASCNFIVSYDNPQNKMHARIFEFSFLNKTEDTILLDAPNSLIEPLSWIYKIDHGGYISIDSMDFESHFNKMDYPIAPQQNLKFIDTIHSPFKTLSNGFGFRYVLKGEVFIVKTNCN